VQVFLAWSGKQSRALATALHDWLPSVLQSVTAFLSAEDIDKGARWVTEIAKGLDDSGFGVLCVTKENAKSDWLNFEAGALSKALTMGRAAPALVDIDPADVTGPLAMFQAVRLTEEDIHGLVRSINTACPTPLEPSRVASAFKQWWPVLEGQLEAIRGIAPDVPVPKRDPGEMVAEVLGIVRSLQRDVRERIQIEGDESLSETPIVVWRPTLAQMASKRFSEQMRVHNPRYGDGTVLKSTLTRVGEELVVKFDDHGVKIFAVSETDITPIETTPEG